MKRFFRLVLCAVAAVAFAGIAQAQQQGGESYLLINAMLKGNMGKLIEYKANLESCRQGTLQEAGNLAYDYYQLCTDPSQILLFEKWKSEADLTKH
ncbi:MAG: antibiotic biosynthesis monooxygenase, partial [Alistipes sp.]|nr:antibiotic biosynthesis monooxygenase [Alistipes sp.]